jgi:hypothetical protein
MGRNPATDRGGIGAAANHASQFGDCEKEKPQKAAFGGFLPQI